MSKKDKPSKTAASGDTRIALVLDRSGSMNIIQEQAREAFNEAVDRVIEEAAKGSGKVTLSLVTFNDEVEEILVNKSTKKVRKLRDRDYVPSGMTALLDAVDRSIDLLQKPGKLGKADGALVIVVTDGHENSSRKTTQADLVERMQKLEGTDQWTFTFMCANVDIKDLSQNLKVPYRNVAAWRADADGAPRMAQELSSDIGLYMIDRREGVRSKKDFFEKRRRQASDASGS